MTKAAGFLKKTGDRQYKELHLWSLRHACRGLRCKLATNALVGIGNYCNKLVARLTSFVMSKQ